MPPGTFPPQYPLDVSAVVSRVNAALASNSRATTAALTNELDQHNNSSGIDAHGNAL